MSEQVQNWAGTKKALQRALPNYGAHVRVNATEAPLRSTFTTGQDGLAGGNQDLRSRATDGNSKAILRSKIKAGIGQA